MLVQSAESGNEAMRHYQSPALPVSSIIRLQHVYYMSAQHDNTNIQRVHWPVAVWGRGAGWVPGVGGTVCLPVRARYVALSSWIYVVCPLCWSWMGIPREELPELAAREGLLGNLGCKGGVIQDVGCRMLGNVIKWKM